MIVRTARSRTSRRSTTVSGMSTDEPIPPVGPASGSVEPTSIPEPADAARRSDEVTDLIQQLSERTLSTVAKASTTGGAARPHRGGSPAGGMSVLASPRSLPNVSPETACALFCRQVTTLEEKEESDEDLDDQGIAASVGGVVGKIGGGSQSPKSQKAITRRDPRLAPTSGGEPSR